MTVARFVCCIPKDPAAAIATGDVIGTSKKKIHRIVSVDGTAACGSKFDTVRDMDCLSDDACLSYCPVCYPPRRRRGRRD